MGGREVTATLDAAVTEHGAPAHLRCDNGGEFISHLLQEWLEKAGIKTRFIEPGSPPGRMGSTRASTAVSATITTTSVLTARSTIARRPIIARNFCAKLRIPVRPAEPGLPSVRSLPWFLIPTTDSAATYNPLRLSSQMVQERESGQCGGLTGRVEGLVGCLVGIHPTSERVMA